MATTNNFSLPYPQGNDPYNIPEDIENLAKSIDSSLKAVSDSVATLDYSTTETVEEVQRNLEILEQEINRAGLPNLEQIMVDIEEARQELEAAKEEFSVGQAELGVHLTNLRDERMPALEASVQEARNEMDTAMEEFTTRQTHFEDSISTAEEDIANAKQRLGQSEDEIAAAKVRLETAETNIQNKVDSSRVDEVEGRVDTALTGPVTHDRLRAGSGAFDSAFVDELWAKNIRALSAELARAVIAAQNLYPDPSFEDDSQYGSWELVDGGIEKNGTNSQSGTYNYNAIPATPGDKFRVRANITWVNGSTGGVSIYVRSINDAGSYISGTANSVIRVSSEDQGFVDGVYTVPENAAGVQVGFFTESDMLTGARARVDSLRLTNMLDGSLVVENSIDTRHLNVTGEMAAALISADKARVIDLIAEDLIANNATIINAAMQNLTVTERAEFVEAFAKELYAERFTAEVARISNLTVAARNLIPGMFNIANETPPPFDVDGFGVNTGDPSVWIRGSSTVNTSSEEDALIYLEAGVNYKFSVETAASVPGTMYYVQLMDEDGNNATDTMVELTETSYLLTQEIAGPNKDMWWPAEATFWVQKTGGYRLKIFANHNRGADNLDGYQWFRNMRVESMNDGRLIVPGSIDASRLNAYEIFSNQLVSDEIWGNIVRAKMLEADEAIIGGALIKDEEITVGKLTALDEILGEMLRVRKIDAGDIAADAITADEIAGGAIDGKSITGATITGGTIRTSASGSRVEMRNDALSAYNSSNQIQARYSGNGIELRPPGGSLTQIGAHIFGAEFFTSPDRSRSNANSNSWSSITSGSSIGSMFIPSNRVRISMSFQYDIGLTGTNIYRAIRFYPRIGGLSKVKELSLHNQPSSTTHNFSYEDIYNVGSIQGTTASISLLLRARAVNVTIQGITLTVTPV